MTRGRKKNMTIPPTRSLLQQRDYRSRKANYVGQLEERCRRAEEENAQLRKELELVRANMPVSFQTANPLVAQASAELSYNLSLASASLVKFQQLAQQNQQLPSGPSGMQASGNLHPASFSPPMPYSTQYPSTLNHNNSARGCNRPCEPGEGTPPCSPQDYTESGPTYDSEFRRRRQRSSSLSSESCCGGILNCKDLCE